jgi:hypothetical protein
MSQQEKEGILLHEVEKFKRLKKDIRRRREEQKSEIKEVAISKEEAVAIDMESSVPDTAKMSSHELFVYALEEIKEVIRAEFRALRAEIKLWRESK